MLVGLGVLKSFGLLGGVCKSVCADSGPHAGAIDVILIDKDNGLVISGGDDGGVLGAGCRNASQCVEESLCCNGVPTRLQSILLVEPESPGALDSNSSKS